MNLYQWAARWNIPAEAIAEYRQLVGIDPAPGAGGDMPEAKVLAQVRLEAARQGIYLWRNNVGATLDQNDRLIRYGLANDSVKVNRNIKSSDLVGIRPGGQFICREVKAAGWQYTGTDREQAQLRWIELILSLGGDAAFATGEGTL